MKIICFTNRAIKTIEEWEQDAASSDPDDESNKIELRKRAEHLIEAFTPNVSKPKELPSAANALRFLLLWRFFGATKIHNLPPIKETDRNYIELFQNAMDSFVKAQLKKPLQPIIKEFARVIT